MQLVRSADCASVCARIPPHQPVPITATSTCFILCIPSVDREIRRLCLAHAAAGLGLFAQAEDQKRRATSRITSVIGRPKNWAALVVVHRSARCAGCARTRAPEEDPKGAGGGGMAVARHPADDGHNHGDQNVEEGVFIA